MCGFAVYAGGDKKLKLEMAHEFGKIQYRGPDNTIIRDFGDNGWMGFHRLKIMDLSDAGNQPLSYNNIHVVCNGEIYNFRTIREQYAPSFPFHSNSDCEVLLPLFLDKGIVGMAEALDAEFVCVIFDDEKKKFYAARDPIGIRPLFYGYTAAQEIMFASEMKVLHNLCDNVYPFRPGTVTMAKSLLSMPIYQRSKAFTTTTRRRFSEISTPSLPKPLRNVWMPMHRWAFC